jgi:hypothetical protein
VSPKCKAIYAAMLVAGLYREKPAITSRVAWDALIALSIDAMGSRRKFEARHHGRE